MKTTAKRGYIVFLLVAAVVAGLSFLAVKLALNGEKWATLRANEHLTVDGSFIAAGNIYDRAGVLLATTECDERIYNDSERIRRSTLHIVGDTEGFVSSGVQTAYKTRLTGFNPFTGIYSLKKYGRGNDITLTVDSALSAAAYDALDGRKGLVAAYNYETGELLCSVSNPSYDIRNKPSAEEIEADETGRYEGVYLNRLIDGLYTPGSIFKIVTTTCAVENMPGLNSWEYECTGETVIGGVKITCPHIHGKLNIQSAFAQSCNCAYAALADKLGAQALTATAEELGFGKSFDFGNMKTAADYFDLSQASAGDIAWAGVGQYTTLVNPYHVLTVAGAIANGGTAVFPYAVASVDSPSGRNIETFTAQSSVYLPPAIALKVSDLMRSNVADNYGDNNFKGLDMCGKTGTAEIGGDKEPHAWFTGFSRNPSCPVAIVVIIENGGWGASQALPVASEVMQAAYKTLS